MFSHIHGIAQSLSSELNNARVLTPGRQTGMQDLFLRGAYVPPVHQQNATFLLSYCLIILRFVLLRLHTAFPPFDWPYSFIILLIQPPR